MPRGRPKKLTTEDKAMLAVGLGVAREMRGKEVTEAVLKQLEQISTDT